MSSGRNISALVLAGLLTACSQAVTRAEAVGRCALQIAYVEAGTTPGVYWMRLCEDSIEFQPLGSRAAVRRPGARRLSGLQSEVASAEFADAIGILVREHPDHDVPPDHAFYAVLYDGRKAHVPPDELPAIARRVFAELNHLFEEEYPAYQDYLVRYAP